METNSIIGKKGRSEKWFCNYRLIELAVVAMVIERSIIIHNLREDLEKLYRIKNLWFMSFQQVDLRGFTHDIWDCFAATVRYILEPLGMHAVGWENIYHEKFSFPHRASCRISESVFWWVENHKGFMKMWIKVLNAAFLCRGGGGGKIRIGGGGQTISHL